MAAYQTSAFQIELPEGFSDISTYAFVVPGGSPEFNRSIVIKMDRMQGDVDLMRYMIDQRSQVRRNADRFEIISEWEGKHGRFNSVTTVFEWNPNAARIRQKQWYIHLPSRSAIWSLTATDLALRFTESEALFDRIADSFIPNG